MALLQRIPPVLDRNSVESHQITAVVSFQLLDIQQKRLQLAHCQHTIFVDHKRTVIYTHLEYFVPSRLLTLRTQLIQYFDIVFGTDDVLLDLIIEFCDVLNAAGIQELIDHCLVLFLLVFFKRNHTVILSVLLDEIGMHVFEGYSAADGFFFEVGGNRREQCLYLFDLCFDFFGWNEL